MKKSFWINLIMCILAFTILFTGILPTNNIVYAEENVEYKENPLVQNQSGWYELTGNSTTMVAGQAVQTPVTATADYYSKIYYLDESGNQKTPQIEGNKVYLEANVEYYVPTDANLGFGVSSPVWALDVETIPEKAAEALGEKIANKDDASLIESLLTKAILLVGAGIYVIVCLVIKEPFTIESVLFNQFSNTKLGFFSGSETNNFIESAGIKTTLNDFFNFFTGIALAVYLIILVYMAVRILMSATAEKGAKHKELLLYWVEGIAILFLFPYVMKYSIEINNTFVEFIYVNKSEYFSSDETPTMDQKDGDLKGSPGLAKQVIEEINDKGDYMSEMFNAGWTDGWLVYAICWYVMFFQMIGFLIVYFKRVLVITFLIAVFPLVMISYAIDKIGDAKSQAFGNWVKEFMLNVFIQSFHVIAYVLIMSLITGFMGDPSENWLLILIALTYISKGDDILRAIFSLNSGADTVKGIGSTIMQTAAITQLAGSARKIGGKLFGASSAPRRVMNGFGALRQRRWDQRKNEANQERLKYEESKLNLPKTVDLGKAETPEDIEKKLKEDMEKLLRGKGKNLTDQELRDAADRLLGYKNREENDPQMEALFNKVMNDMNLSEDERKMLDSLLAQNAAVNKLMLGGREININQEINVILTHLKRGKDGKLTPESRALLAKIGKTEEDLQRILMMSNIKFNKERVGDTRNTKGNGNRNSRSGSRGSRIQGRGAAKNRTDRERARNSIEYNKKRNATKSATERAMDRTGRSEEARTRQAESLSSRNVTLKRSKKKKAPHQNVVSVTGSAGLEIAKHGAAAKFKASKTEKKPSLVQTSGTKTRREKREKSDATNKLIRYKMATTSSSGSGSSGTTNYGNKIPEKKVISSSPDSTPHTVRELMQAKKEVREENRKKKLQKDSSGSRNSTAFKINRNVQKTEDALDTGGSSTTARTNSTANTRQNVGAEIANRAGSAEQLSAIIYVSSAFDFFKDEETKVIETIKEGAKVFKEGYDKNAPNKENDKKEKQEEESILEKYKDKSLSSAVKNDLQNALKYIDILNGVSSGTYTAKELLQNLALLKDLLRKYENGSVDERMAFEEVMRQLGGSIADYESIVRVKILNDPDSVGNDQKIIDESKAYMKETEVPSIIRDRLGYTQEQLDNISDLRYANKKNTDYAGFVSEEQKTKAQSEYEEKLKLYRIQRERAELEKEAKEKFGFKNYERDIGKIAFAAAESAYDLATAVAATGTGFVTMGLATDGKKETITQATTNFFAGYTASNTMTDAVKERIKPLTDNLVSDKTKSSGPITTRDFPTSDIEYYRERSSVKGKPLAGRGKREDND